MSLLDLAGKTDMLATFAEPASRAAALAALARGLGGEDLIIFTPDPELHVMLPAPGLPQTLKDAASWRAFVAMCSERETHRGELTAADGRVVPAQGCVAGDAVAVLLGAQALDANLGSVCPLFVLLGALFTAERRADAAEIRVTAAAAAVERSHALAETLQKMRIELEAALRAADQARAESTRQAEKAAAYAAELETQAHHLEEQATELEMLNSELESANHDAHKARAAADAANRAKSQFLANMSHELRTPINAIIGYTELLTIGVSGAVNEEQLSYLARVRASSKHLLTLIDDVLDLAKVEAGQMSVTFKHGMAATSVNDAVALVAIQASERGITLLDECSDSPAQYIGDDLRVRQILANLLSNAVKFTEPGGRIVIRCGTLETTPEGLDLPGQGPWTFIEVEDTGVGIADQEIAQIFRPFVQAEMGRHRTHSGTGLGLTISRQLARLMGGDLCVSSLLGKGSTFTLWLATEEAAAGEIDDSIRA